MPKLDTSFSTAQLASRVLVVLQRSFRAMNFLI
jgi:hypothetical protein